MKYTLDQLFCNIETKPLYGYIFELPGDVYISRVDAIAVCDSEVEETVTLQQAFNRVSRDIKHDS